MRSSAPRETIFTPNSRSIRSIFASLSPATNIISSGSGMRIVIFAFAKCVHRSAAQLGWPREDLGDRRVIELTGFVLREPRPARGLVLALGHELVDRRAEARLFLRLYRGEKKAHGVTTEGLAGTHRGYEIALEPLLQLRAYAPSSASALAALRFLALATRCRSLVKLAAAGLREDPGLLDLLIESAKRRFKRLAITNDHFRQRFLA